MADAEPADEEDRDCRGNTADEQARPQPLGLQFGDALTERLGLQQHGLRVDRRLVGGLLDVLQSRGRIEQLLHRIGEIDPLLVDLGQDFLRAGVVHRADVEVRIAVDQA